MDNDGKTLEFFSWFKWVRDCLIAIVWAFGESVKVNQKSQRYSIRHQSHTNLKCDEEWYRLSVYVVTVSMLLSTEGNFAY